MASKLPQGRGCDGSIEDALRKLSDEQLMGEFDDIYRDMPVTDDTACGWGFLRGPKTQKLANKKVLVVLYGVLSLVFASAGAYFSGTITTIEKRFKIPSKNMGIISVGNDISSLVLSGFIAYYGGKSHRPRWIGVGLSLIVLNCLLNASPHFFYGAGDEALALTSEYGGVSNDQQSEEAQEAENRKLLCRTNATQGVAECEMDGGNLMPQVLLFLAQIVSGIGGSLCSTLGISYMDDNIKKSKTAAIMSISMFLRLLGPAAGYSLASICLKMYIAPDLTPVINSKDSRWLGAWWFGWLFYAFVLSLFSLATTLLPKELPRSAVRKRIEKEKIRRGLKEADANAVAETKASLSDMIVTFKRVFNNKIFMTMHIAGVLHLFGFLPYWIYTPKIIETIYHQSASASSFYTGTLAIVFSGVGVLAGGMFISKFKPSARFLTMWHVICGFFCVAGMISYGFMGCAESDKTLSIHQNTDVICSSDCHCDFVRYSPVCGDDGLTYTSACHAGCRTSAKRNGSKAFGNCSCIVGSDEDISIEQLSVFSVAKAPTLATSGPCAVDCKKELFIFLAVMCFLKFIGATGRTSNFLVSIRCIDEKDKSVAIGLGSIMVHLFALIPSPILFGYILDRACLVWGRTCNGTGNCWQYDSETLRYLLNFTAAFFVLLGTIADFGVWYYVKDLKIFDEEDKMEKAEKKTDEKKGDEATTRY